MFINLLFSAFLGLAWYYGILTIALTAIALRASCANGQSPDFFGVKLPPEMAKTLSEIGQGMGGWSVWLIVSVFLSVFPATPIINRAAFLKKYIDKRWEGKSIRAKIRRRAIWLRPSSANATLNAVLENENYEKVTVLSHSFGVTIN